MITGDFPSHEVWAQSREWNLAHSKMMSEMVTEIFPDTLILPSIGNHESFPTNRFDYVFLIPLLILGFKLVYML